MKHKFFTKIALIFTLLVAVALCLLGLPCGDARAGPPEPTPSPAIDIRSRLQPYQTPGAGAFQADGQLLEEAPLPSETEEPPISTLDEQTFYAVADATVLQGYPSENFGDTADMWAGYDEYLDPYGRIARSLVRFNIASLPSNVDVNQATLRVYLVNSWDYPYTSRTIRTYRITSNWSESSVTWNSRPGYGSAYGSRSIVHGAWGWYEFDVTGLVRAWYAGTYNNYGVMLRGPEVSGLDSSWRGFGTRESSYRPRLVVEYTAVTPTPTPTSTPTPEPSTEWKIYLPMAAQNWSPPPTPTPPPTEHIPCLIVIGQEMPLQPPPFWAGCAPTSGRPPTTTWRRGSSGAYVGFDYTIEDSQGAVVYHASIDIERRSSGQIKSYNGTVSGRDFTTFTQVVTNKYNPQGGLIGADVVKTYTGGYQYQMEITQYCPTPTDLTGYTVSYNSQEVSLGSCR